MTEQEKRLLLKDLCARLPYGIIGSVRGSDEEFQHFYILGVKDDKVWVKNDMLCVDDFDDVEVVKPYLRPMSSMTEEEKIELKEYLGAEEVGCDGFGYIEGGTLEDYISRTPYSLCNYVIDWLNAHHFDFRNLVGKGLAIDCTDLNIY